MENKDIDYQFCSRECPLGQAMKKKFLDEQNSAYDAALDMAQFVEKCAKTCERYKKEDSNG